MSSNQEYDCKTRFSPSQSPEIQCALCHERLKDAHSHPGQWNSELQQFLLQYTTVPLSSCVCKADEVSIRRGLGGKQKGFIPRWVKREMQKQKQSCCVPGCCVIAERTCVFASFDTICAASNASSDEPATGRVTDSLPLCIQHYHTVYKYCNPENVPECALCGSKRRHRVSRIQFEDELPPSFDALWRHWLRTCWVSSMWSQATQKHMSLLDLTQYGWKVVEGKLECDWESDENQTAVRERVGLLFRGCSCSSVTACSTRRCGCVKKGSKCGPGCRCKNCSNTVNVVTSAPGTQQHNPVELLEVEQEELLHDDLLRMEYGEECVGEENDEYDVYHSEEEEGNEEQELEEEMFSQ